MPSTTSWLQNIPGQKFWDKVVTPVIKPRMEALMVEEKTHLTFNDIQDVEMNIVDDVADASDDSKH